MGASLNITRRIPLHRRSKQIINHLSLLSICYPKRYKTLDELIKTLYYCSGTMVAQVASRAKVVI
jgi:hypothetical protein